MEFSYALQISEGYYLLFWRLLNEQMSLELNSLQAVLNVSVNGLLTVMSKYVLEKKSYVIDNRPRKSVLIRFSSKISVLVDDAEMSNACTKSTLKSELIVMYEEILFKKVYCCSIGV